MFSRQMNAGAQNRKGSGNFICLSPMIERSSWSRVGMVISKMMTLTKDM